MNLNIKPVFRYIGGKTWMKKHLNESLEKILINNQKINSYYEPFAGGLGSLFSNLELLYKYDIKNIHLNDINTCLINVYKYILYDKENLIESYSTIEENMLLTIPENTFNLHKINDKDKIKTLLKDSNDFFKQKRTIFNNNKNSNEPLITSALFLFLANHSFNGIYRENSKGEYNAAFNWEAKNFKHVINKIHEVNHVLKHFNVTFYNNSFENIEILDNQLIYADPPYINEKLNTENNYHSDKFDINKIEKLVKYIKNNDFIFSHYHNFNIIHFFNNEFSADKIKIDILNKKNRISSNANTRSNIKKEMLIYTI